MTEPEKPAVRTASGRLPFMRSALATNRVLRNTYLFLPIALLFSILCAGVSLGLDLPHPGLLVTLAGYFGLVFLATKFRESAAGLGFVFALTGFMGYTLDPILSGYLAISGGPLVVITALGGAATIFINLSVFALTTRRHFSFMDAVLLATLGAVMAGLGTVFFEVTGFVPALFATFVLLMSGFILYETRSILRSGETNYIMATVVFYVAIVGLFTSSLHLVGSIEGDE